MVQYCKLPFVLLVNFFLVNDRSKRIFVRLFVSWTHKIMKVRCVTMDCVIKRIAENVVVMTTDKGNTIKLVFRKEDNPDIENIVTDNLLISYERRIRNSILSESC